MAAPQLQQITVKVADQVLMTFDQPLDTSVLPPVTCFSINYGRIPITQWEYWGTAAIILKLSKPLTPQDKIQVNYQPPDDLAIALRAPTAPNPNAVVIRRNAVRAFFKVPANLQLDIDEGTWNENANLGVNDDQRQGGGTTCSNGALDGNDSDGYGNYPYQSRPNPRTATPDDFIIAFGLKEAIQVSNIDNADATQPNNDRIWMAIQDASARIDNYIVQASQAGKLLISSNRRRTALIIARYYLDSVRRREDVKEDYENCIKELDRASTMEDLVRPDLPWWQDPCNKNRGCGVRAWRTPQYYNGVSGKGFSGWWNDSGFEEVDDWRYDRLNAEGNNDQPNWRTATDKDDDARKPSQPADDGGIRHGNNNSP